MNKSTFKKLISLLLALVLVFSFAASSFATVTEKKNELNDINSKLKDNKDKIKENENKLSDLSKEIVALDEKINVLNADIEVLTKDINDTKELIKQKLEELDRKQNEIDQQDAALNSRLRAMYKNGNAGMLSVLLNSRGISELLTNIEMAKRIYASDSNLLYKMHVEYDVIYEAKVQLTELKDKLQEQQDELDAKRSVLAAQEWEAESKRSAIKADNEELLAQEKAMEQQAEALVSIIKEMQSDADVYVYQDMCWPSQASTRVTSPFGYRYIFGGYSFHSGIDIGAYGGSNILAAQTGTVMYVGWDPNGYGNYVMIDHGSGVVTLYAHSRKILVSQGEHVKKGQVIALVGTTGLSTGNHLHFEIRVNGKRQDPLDTTLQYYVVPGAYSYD